MSRSVDNSQDILDSRDVIKRIEELEGEREALVEAVAEAATALREADSATLAESEEELTEAAEDAQAALEEWDAENGEEFKALLALADEGEGSPDWRHGETLIRDSYFENYARDLAEDIGAISKEAAWPARCIDWEQAADELKMDYFTVDFDGIDYWIRS